MTTRLTRFFGREAEITQVADLLHERRLVTLSGPGGAGKTRLALEVCERERTAAFDEVWFVDVGAVMDGSPLARRVAGALGVAVAPGADPVAAVISRLGSRRLLLVLDTCEHLTESVGVLVVEFLDRCPGLVVLATSRTPIGVQGEAVFGVPPLNREAAVELFVDRASLAQPAFDTEVALSEAETICDRVDRIPLGIELAASWVGTLTPAEIAAGLDDALELLSADTPALNARHRTLRASLAWSYELLTDDEQAFFRRLGVFAGAFDADAAARVTSVRASRRGSMPALTLVLLRRLRAASLLVAIDTGDGTRYRFLDTVRQFAVDRLHAAGELDQTRERHLDEHLRFAKRGEVGLDQQMDQWRERLAVRHDDIAAALRWALAEPDAPADRIIRGCQLAAAMARYWMLSGNTHNGLDFLARASALAPASDEDPAAARLRSRLCSGTAMVAMVAGHRSLVTEAAERAFDDAIRGGDPATQARSRILVAFPLFFTDFARCHDIAISAAVDAAHAGDAFARDWSRVTEGFCQQTRGHHQEAIAAARTAVSGAMARGDRFTAAFGLGVELFVAMVNGQVDKAIDLGRRSVELAAPLGDYFAVGTNTVNAALPLALSGDLDAAHRLMDPVVAGLESAPPADVVGFMVSFGYAALWGGNLDTALRWFRLGVASSTDGSLDWTAGRCLPGLVKTLRHLGDDNALREAEWAVEVETAFDTPYELASVLDELGHLLKPSDPGRAREHHHDALDLRIRHGIRIGYVDSLDALAAIEADTGNPTHATRLLAAASSGRESMHYPRPAVDREGHEQVVALLRHELGDQSFTAAWHDGANWDLDEAVAALNRGRGPRRRPDTGWESLTPTESQVVDLVAAGHTNPQVAQRLFMSRSTVKTHLTHIYAKLGLAGRTQLATAAATRQPAAHQPTDRESP